MLGKDGKEVRIVVINPDGEVTPEADLSKALHTALGSRGTVEFRNREPMVISTGGQPIRLVSKGTLRLRSAPGVGAVLRIDRKGLKQKPFLATGPSVDLEIEGLTFEVFDSGPPPDKPAPSIVLAPGRARFDHCAWRSTAAAGSCAIVSEGEALNVAGCWFEGFDAAIEIRTVARSQNTIRQTMIVPGRSTTTEAALPDRVGWGVRVLFVARANAKRELRLEHCTFAGAGLLGLSEFSCRPR